MERLSLPLRFYLALSVIADGAYALLHRRRIARGKEDPTRIQERRGRATVPRPDGSLVWLHAASVGETLSLFGLIERLKTSHPDATVLMTSTTLTSATLIARDAPVNTIHQFSPDDTSKAVRAFLDHWKPDIAVWTESELWPRLLQETHDRGIPMFLINARVSVATARRWRTWPRTARALLSGFEKILVQEATTAKLMTDIGSDAARITVSGSLKEDLPPPDADPAALREFEAALGSRRAWLAASTHEGEDRVLIAAHEDAFANEDPRPLLILVPRHPDRGPGLATELIEAGFSIALRSRRELPGTDTDIFIADTIGEMGLWFRIAPVAFIGGSLVEIGGHNPYEAAALDCAILHGPHVFNFAEIYQRLDKTDGAIMASDASVIGASLSTLLHDEDRRAELVRAARRACVSGSDATGEAFELISGRLQTAKQLPSKA